jgi:phospholipid transport system transporter-binding protein
MAEALAIALPSLPATLTHAQAEDYVARCRAALAAVSSPPFVARVDAAALHDFDSSALAALLAVRREVLARGGDWQVSGLPPRARVLAGLYGVAELLPS